MGKFDGYLICSDLDGTFSGGGDTVEVNSRAVKYFTENGGRFTFTTGRTATYLPEQEFFDIINAPVGVFNGGIIYDYETEKVLKESRLEFKLGDFIDVVGNRKDEITALGIYSDCHSPWQRQGSFEAYANQLSSQMVKIVCVFENCEKADEFKDFALKQDLFKNTYISKSWNEGVEFNAIDGTKGQAVEFIKNYLGDIHTSIGIGDFENDINLLKHADIGVATGNAVDSVKEVADFAVKDCKDYAIKDLIEIIEQGL